MRRIEFLAPVEAMRGNLSGNQNLVYPTANNTAWDGPSGKRNYARNYSTRYIGAKRADNNLKFFGVKTKTACTLTPKSRRAMAVFGGTGAIYANIVTNKGDLYTQCMLYYQKTQEFGNRNTFRVTICQIIREMLQKYSERGYRIVSGVSVSIDNPWMYAGEGSPNVSVPSAIYQKFYGQLRQNGFTVGVRLPDGQSGYMNVVTGTAWSGMIPDVITGYIVNGRQAGQLSIEGTDVRATVGESLTPNAYLCINGAAVKASDTAVIDGDYYISETKPA